MLFAEEFYDAMLMGRPFGAAVHQARRELFANKHYQHLNTWGAYQCYGDPGFKLVQGTEQEFRLPEVGGESVDRQSSSGIVAKKQLLEALAGLAAEADSITRDGVEHEGSAPQGQRDRIVRRLNDLEEQTWDLKEVESEGSENRAVGAASWIDGETIYHFANVYRALGNWDEAAARYGESVLSDGAVPLDALYWSATCHLHAAESMDGSDDVLKRLTEAETLFERLVAVAPTEQNHRTLADTSLLSLRYQQPISKTRLTRTRRRYANAAELSRDVQVHKWHLLLSILEGRALEDFDESSIEEWDEDDSPTDWLIMRALAKGEIAQWSAGHEHDEQWVEGVTSRLVIGMHDLVHRLKTSDHKQDVDLLFQKYRLLAL